MINSFFWGRVYIDMIYYDVICYDMKYLTVIFHRNFFLFIGILC